MSGSNPVKANQQNQVQTNNSIREQLKAEFASTNQQSVSGTQRVRENLNIQQLAQRIENGFTDREILAAGIEAGINHPGVTKDRLENAYKSFGRIFPITVDLLSTLGRDFIRALIN